MSHTFVIAEAGSCHDQDADKAKALVQAAKDAGADAVKFQFWSDSKELSRRRHAPELESTYAKYKIPEGWVKYLAAYAKEAGLEFMCTTYLYNDILLVTPYVSRYKIASFEANDQGFISKHVLHMRGQKEIIVSLGMAQELPKHFQGIPSISTLYCVSAYPTETHDLNLSRMGMGGHDGLSDHTCSAATGALAVAAGARIIEKHLRLADTLPTNPDYPHSLDPGLFRKYVMDIRWAEKVMGTMERRPVQAELKNMKYKVY